MSWTDSTCPAATYETSPRFLRDTDDCVPGQRHDDGALRRRSDEGTKAVDHAALVRVDMATFTVEIESSKAGVRELNDAIKRAGYSPIAA